MSERENYISIKQWAEDDRPREKLMEKGRGALSDAELLAILIGSGSRNESAVQLCQRILAFYGNNLGELAKVGIEDLKKFKGVGEAKAISIIAALEIGRRRKSEAQNENKKVMSSKDAYEFISEHLLDLPYEEFWVIHLNRANKVVGKDFLSRGGISGTVVDTRLIFKLAIEKLSSSIILAHNHPSGNLQPSAADLQLTKRVIEAGKLFEINVADHLIIGNNQYYSFADNGKMSF